MIKVDAKARRVDVSQRSEEERAADAKLSREGASSILKTAGMNTLQAALARAGISKTDFEDLSQVCLPCQPRREGPQPLPCMHARQPVLDGAARQGTAGKAPSAVPSALCARPLCVHG